MTTRIIFITGTDTGVGKTVLTSLLLCHLQARGANVLALKPFCSGGRADAQLLRRLHDRAFSLDEINPFYFPEPVAPLVSARNHSRPVSLSRVLKHIETMAVKVSDLPSIKNSKFKNDYLLIEGSGGLLVPLGEDYTVRDLISHLACDVLVVSRNQLGTINHTLLTLEALGLPTRTGRVETSHSPSSSILHPPSFPKTPPSALRTPHSTRVVLMHPSKTDPSCRTNPLILSQLLPRIPFLQLPFLGRHCASPSFLRKAADDLRRRLAQLV